MVLMRLSLACTAILVLATVTVIGCSGKSSNAATGIHVTLGSVPPSPNLDVPVGKYGIACLMFPGVSYPSYSARDIGKAGVPGLSAYQRRLVRKIQFRTKSQTIRFVPSTRKTQIFYPLAGDFIVFDAVHGPCASYWIQNQPVLGNEFYAPTLMRVNFPMT